MGLQRPMSCSEVALKWIKLAMEQWSIILSWSTFISENISDMFLHFIVIYFEKSYISTRFRFRVIFWLWKFLRFTFLYRFFNWKCDLLRLKLWTPTLLTISFCWLLSGSNTIFLPSDLLSLSYCLHSNHIVIFPYLRGSLENHVGTPFTDTWSWLPRPWWVDARGNFTYLSGFSWA